MHRKIHFGLALIILAIIATIFALVITVQAYSPSMANNAFSTKLTKSAYFVGGRIVSYVPTCTMASPITSNAPVLLQNFGYGGYTCPAVPCPCTRCGCVSAPCTPPPPLWSEIVIVPYGSNSQTVVCAPLSFPFIGGYPSSGRTILGTGTNSYAPLIMGLGN